jgi:hypothetical protein
MVLIVANSPAPGKEKAELPCATNNDGYTRQFGFPGSQEP